MPDDLVLVTDPLEARLLAPTALNRAALAAAELNAAGGILGRPVELVYLARADGLDFDVIAGG